jgi:hypothetical protein
MNSPNGFRPSSYNFPSLRSILDAEAALYRVLGPHVYVGGACVGFYVDDPAAAELRPTLDVDVVVAMASNAEQVELDEALRRNGLRNDMNGPICRWKLGPLTIDVMPADKEIFGFSNSWYAAALAAPIVLEIESQIICIPNACTFLATKIEAFDGRGGGDFVLSQDFEDIVRVLDGCSFLVQESAQASPDVRAFVGVRFSEWLQNRDFLEGLAIHVMDGREEIALEQVKRLIGLG